MSSLHIFLCLAAVSHGLVDTYAAKRSSQHSARAQRKYSKKEKKQSSSKKEQTKFKISNILIVSICFLIPCFCIYAKHSSVQNQEEERKREEEEINKQIRQQQKEERKKAEQFIQKIETDYSGNINKIDTWLWHIKTTKPQNRPWETFSEKYLITEKKNSITCAHFTDPIAYIDEKFKKIYWGERRNIKEDIARGFDLFIVLDQGDLPFLKSTYSVHPQLCDEFTQYLRCLKRDAEGAYIPDCFELGAMLSFSLKDAFAFSFNKKTASNAYPHVTWKNRGFNPLYLKEDEMEELLKKGLNRLKECFGNKLPYILAGAEPDETNIPTYGSRPYSIEDGWGHQA